MADRMNLLYALNCISVFRDILNRPTMKALKGVLSSKSLEDKLNYYGEFVYSLGEYGGSFSNFLEGAIYEDENVYVKAKARRKEVPASVIHNAVQDLELFTALTELTPSTLFEGTGYMGYLPEFSNDIKFFVRLYSERLQSISKYGYGIFSTHSMFRLEDGTIAPVMTADSIVTDCFVGYERERQQVIDNTRALVEGRPAANTLLCGDAGTGKSSTVKAAANMFFSEGVRLIEIRKDQLFSLGHIMAQIADNPLKFIIFIDDLSFNKNDDCFSMLKAALEGSASAKAPNAVIYATSNRRHIVKESFSDRAQSDDIHHSDTVQELLSLSDRFGLVVYFSKPSKALYLEIVHELARRAEVDMDMAELDLLAERYALAKGSRSPRAALQFINSLL